VRQPFLVRPLLLSPRAKSRGLAVAVSVCQFARRDSSTRYARSGNDSLLLRARNFWRTPSPSVMSASPTEGGHPPQRRAAASPSVMGAPQPFRVRGVLTPHPDTPEDRRTAHACGVRTRSHAIRNEAPITEMASTKAVSRRVEYTRPNESQWGLSRVARSAKETAMQEGKDIVLVVDYHAENIEFRRFNEATGAIPFGTQVAWGAAEISCRLPGFPLAPILTLCFNTRHELSRAAENPGRRPRRIQPFQEDQPAPGATPRGRDRARPRA